MLKKICNKLIVYSVCVTFIFTQQIAVSLAEENKIIIIKKVIKNDKNNSERINVTSAKDIQNNSKNNKKKLKITKTKKKDPKTNNNKNVKTDNNKKNIKKNDENKKKSTQNEIKKNIKDETTIKKTNNKNVVRANESQQIIEDNKLNPNDITNNSSINTDTPKNDTNNINIDINDINHMSAKNEKNNAINLITMSNKGKQKNNNNIIFPKNNNINDLIDKNADSSIPKKEIKINTRNKGVPSVCMIKTRQTKQQQQNEKKINKELEKAKKHLKKQIKDELVINGINKELIKYITNNLLFIKKTATKNSELKKRTMTDTIKKYNVPSRSEKGKAYKQFYLNNLKDIEKMFAVEPNIILAIWAMETNYSSFIGDYNVFNALYSACLNADNINYLRYFKNNIISLAILIENGYFDKNVISSFDGGLGGCQFMPLAAYDYAVSMQNDKPDIINDNNDIFASIANYLNNQGWRHNEGILTEIYIPDKFDICNVGMNTVRSVAKWKKMGIKPNISGIGSEYMKNDNALASIIIVDINEPKVSKKDKRAFLVYDNFKVILTYNPRLQYAITTGLIYEGIGRY